MRDRFSVGIRPEGPRRNPQRAKRAILCRAIVFAVQQRRHHDAAVSEIHQRSLSFDRRTKWAAIADNRAATPLDFDNARSRVNLAVNFDIDGQPVSITVIAVFVPIARHQCADAEREHKQRG